VTSQRRADGPERSEFFQCGRAWILN